MIVQYTQRQSEESTGSGAVFRHSNGSVSIRLRARLGVVKEVRTETVRKICHSGFFTVSCRRWVVALPDLTPDPGRLNLWTYTPFTWHIPQQIFPWGVSTSRREWFLIKQYACSS